MILGIIQARMDSTRLPGKVMAEVGGMPLVGLVRARMKRSQMIDKLVVSTTSGEGGLCGANFYEPLPRDPLGGFCACAEYFGADIVVRITADDPLKDPELVDKAISYMLQKPGLEYCSNTIRPTYPRGLDVEVLHMRTLQWLDREAPLHREHVTSYITENPSKFKVYNFCYDEDLHDWNWSIDTKEDLERMRELISHFDAVNVGYEEVIEYVKTHRQREKVRRGGVAS